MAFKTFTSTALDGDVCIYLCNKQEIDIHSEIVEEWDEFKANKMC